MTASKLKPGWVEVEDIFGRTKVINLSHFTCSRHANVIHFKDSEHVVLLSDEQHERFMKGIEEYQGPIPTIDLREKPKLAVVKELKGRRELEK